MCYCEIVYIYLTATYMSINTISNINRIKVRFIVKLSISI